MLTPKEISECHFVPMSTMHRVLDMLESSNPHPDKRCKRNLLLLRSNRRSLQYDAKYKNWRQLYYMALNRAIHENDWNKLLYLLKKSPIWEHSSERLDERSLYIRALTILLMYHPSSKVQGLLNDYLHMVLSCRTDEDKKAALKVVLSMQNKILGKTNYRMVNGDD